MKFRPLPPPPKDPRLRTILSARPWRPISPRGRVKYVMTRYPPEPNGWLHIGHAKALSISFGVAEQFGGKCNLRFDDTNPEKEDISYVEAIKKDIAWMGYDWEDREYYASDYYEKLYDLAVKIIKKGHAYVDDLSAEEMSEYRGTNVPDKNNITVTPPGKDSPYRTRTVEENLDLFARMRAGRIPRRLEDPPGQDRHGPSQPPHARSSHVPHSPRAALSDGNQVVHLPDVRLPASALRRHRRHNSLSMLPRVRDT